MESGSKNYPFRALEVSEGLDIPSINSLFDNSHKIEKTVDDLHNSSLSSDWARSLNLPQVRIKQALLGSTCTPPVSHLSSEIQSGTGNRVQAGMESRTRSL
eukprot:gb/GECG01000300.1/.p1 GENE.gb/GECG01000300.1/~~gb/GECG01000300.1/.p1  ORF type:complete len:101 (+),score=7.10 gb/GECG01000300.1/:1-303(+)